MNNERWAVAIREERLQYICYILYKALNFVVLPHSGPRLGLASTHQSKATGEAEQILAEAGTELITDVLDSSTSADQLRTRLSVRTSQVAGLGPSFAG